VRTNYLILLMLFLVAPLRAAVSEPEISAFNPAAKAFQDRLFERAEREFGEFVKKFPNSEKRGEAILLQAEARYELGLFEAAIRLLNESFKQAGALADQYLFWLGECNLQKANYPEAAAAYGRLLQEHPASSWRLAASYGQALASFRLNDPQTTIRLLQPPESDFQRAATNSTNRTLAAKGFLLLAEAQMLKRDYAAGRETLGRTTLTNLPPDQEWFRQQLFTRVEIAQDQRQAALSRTTNLVALAESLKQPGLLAHAFTLQAEVLQLLERPVQAAEAYDRILGIPDMPAPMLRQSLQRIIDMLVAQNQLTNAVERLERFIRQNPKDTALDSLQVNLGEIKLKEFKILSGSTNGLGTIPLLTNLLNSARGHFDLVISQLTNSVLTGKALLDRGWILWEEAKILDQPGRLFEAQTAFEAATRKLPKSEDQATARFKWADCQYKLKDYASAITNYLYLIQSYEEIAPIKASLFDQVYYQLARLRLDQNDLPNAAQAVENLLILFPTNPLTEHALLLYAQALNENGKAAPARESLLNFTRRFPLSNLKPEAELAMARTYIGQRDWTNALGLYNTWLTNYLQHPSRPQAMFDRAWVCDLAQQETNAFNYFTNFVATFPRDPLAQKAQNWVANYYFNQENWSLAELNYQLVYQNTNWPATDLAFQARLMAAKTAFARQGYNNASGYLTNLLADPLCPTTLRPQAFFMLGDVLVEQIATSTNRLANFNEAFQAFDRITTQYKTNRITPLAWGRIGDCHLQYASETPENYEKAMKAYQQVLDWKSSEVPVLARNQAEVGIGTCLEKMAKLKVSSDEQKLLLEKALEHYLNVVYGKNLLPGETPDPVFLRNSAFAAGRLLSDLNRKSEAVEIYKRIREPLPSLKATIEQRVGNLLQAGETKNPL
jgi:TolA-binding protein